MMRANDKSCMLTVVVWMCRMWWLTCRHTLVRSYICLTSRPSRSTLECWVLPATFDTGSSVMNIQCQSVMNVQYSSVVSFPATTRACSAVGPSLLLAQWSGTHCQTSAATQRYRLTVSIASLKHSCLQTRISVHSVLEIFCWCAI